MINFNDSFVLSMKQSLAFVRGYSDFLEEECHKTNYFNFFQRTKLLDELIKSIEKEIYLNEIIIKHTKAVAIYGQLIRELVNNGLPLREKDA